jgi:hypothetical protein
MKVTPIKKKFGKYAPGDEFELPDKMAKVFIKVGKLARVESPAPVYQTRMMQAAPVQAVVAPAVLAEPAAGPAPYGYKADGTPRKRPGRAAVAD